MTIKSGKVAGLRRTKIFTRVKPAQNVTNRVAKVPSDHDYKIKQLNRTIEAARQYADTRARLKAAANYPSSAGPISAEIYTATQPDGSVYFGDRPPPNE